MRLIRTPSAGLVLRHIDGPIGRLPGPAELVPLDGDHRHTFLLVWGLRWTVPARERATAQTQAGERAWFCQRCSGYTCEECGSPLRRMPGADVLAADGEVLHDPLLPVPVRCAAGHSVDQGTGTSHG